MLLLPLNKSKKKVITRDRNESVKGKKKKLLTKKRDDDRKVIFLSTTKEKHTASTARVIKKKFFFLLSRFDVKIKPTNNKAWFRLMNRNLYVEIWKMCVCFCIIQYFFWQRCVSETRIIFMTFYYSCSSTSHSAEQTVCGARWSEREATKTMGENFHFSFQMDWILLYIIMCAFFFFFSIFYIPCWCWLFPFFPFFFFFCLSSFGDGGIFSFFSYSIRVNVCEYYNIMIKDCMNVVCFV